MCFTCTNRTAYYSISKPWQIFIYFFYSKKNATKPDRVKVTWDYNHNALGLIYTGVLYLCILDINTWIRHGATEPCGSLAGTFMNRCLSSSEKHYSCKNSALIQTVYLLSVFSLLRIQSKLIYNTQYGDMHTIKQHILPRNCAVTCYLHTALYSVCHVNMQKTFLVDPYNIDNTAVHMI